jgi:hypothetical protein
VFEASRLFQHDVKADDERRHRTFSTTQGYIREAEAIRDGFGEVLPTLPASLGAVPEKQRNSHQSSGESSERHM